MKRAILLILVTATTAAHSADYFSLMARGQMALQAEDYETARLALEQAVALRPSDPVTRYALGITYSRLEKYRLAVTQLEEVVRMSPGHAGALVELGSIASAFGRFDQAVERLREALLADSSPPVKRALAATLVKQGQFGEALVLLEELVDENRSDVESLYQLGIVLMREGDCAGAAERFRNVIRYHPRHTAALFNLGNCYNRIGRSDEAGRVLSMFREVAGEDQRRTDRRRQTLLLLQEADALLRGPNVDAALGLVEEAIRINPTDFKPHAFRGQCLEAKGDIAGALESFKRAAELNPLDPVILMETGRLHGMSGRFRDAIPYLNRAADIDPLMAEPHLFLAAAYRELGLSADAAREQRTYHQLLANSDRRTSRSGGL